MKKSKLNLKSIQVTSFRTSDTSKLFGGGDVVDSGDTGCFSEGDNSCGGSYDQPCKTYMNPGCGGHVD